MRRTRSMTFVFLIASAAFVFVPSFREAFTEPMRAQRGLTRATEGLAEDVLRLAKAEGGRDAATQAQAAMFASDPREAERHAEAAVRLDPQLGWIYYRMIHSHRKDPAAEAWARKLIAFDPENAVPYLALAEVISAREGLRDLAADLPGLAARSDWVAVMEKGFGASKYDPYHLQFFEFERKWLRAQGQLTPARIVLGMASSPVPNFANIRAYADLQVNLLGRQAEEARNPDDALRRYWAVFHAGERMNGQLNSMVEKITGVTIMEVSVKRLAPLLRQRGQADAAHTVEAVAKALGNAHSAQYRNRFSQASNYTWNALVLALFGGLVVIFAVLTFVSIAYTNWKRFFGTGKQGVVFSVLTIAENYMPVLLFMSCLGVYVSYYPYARNFVFYMSESNIAILDWEPLLQNIVPMLGLLSDFQSSVPLGTPLFPYVWYLLGGFALLLAANRMAARRPGTGSAKSAGA